MGLKLIYNSQGCQTTEECPPPDEIMVTGPGEASELLRRREVPTPERFKKSTRKRR
jgi:hypothetical protein